MPNYLTHLDHTFRALADPTRRAVLQALRPGPASVGTLAEPFQMALPSFLQHLRILENGGLITTRKQGRTRICSLRPERLDEAGTWLDDQRRLWTRRLDQLDTLLLTLKDKDQDR